MAAVLAGIVLAALLGAVQLASSAAYGDLAVRPSLPALLHDRAPGLLRPFLGGAAAQAAAALHNGDLETAQRLVATLPPGPETADLRGRIAEAKGDRSGAIAAYVEAGDVVRAQALIDALATSDPATALRDQQRLVAALRDNAGAAEVTGEAWWRLGQLQAAAGYRDAARKPGYWHDAETSYEHALAYGPNEETYLLAAGFQSLANGDVRAAARWYAHAAEVVPDSADAYAGLAWTAAAAGDCAPAREYLQRARALYARATATGTTTAAKPLDPVDNPLAGAALKRCTT
jgi:tetratricopeptide (TPR) repeat protein